MSATVYIALGSNLGERREYLDRALALLAQRPGIQVVRVSSYHETDPVGGPPGQGQFLNAAAELLTDLKPIELLQTLFEVEKTLGRIRQERHGPRTIDLDLLLYDLEECALHEAGLDLILPHPDMHERVFVLAPLAEIAPVAVHPRLQSTVRDLLRELKEGRTIGRELTGKTAMITGSTSGIGRAIALELASAGAEVIIHGRSDAAAKDVVRRAGDLGAKAHVLLADLHDEAAWSSLVDAAWKIWQRVDIWINNAGADTLTGEAAGWSFAQKLEELWTVDVRATIALSRQVGERMQERGSGVILNMGWDQAETGMEGDSGQLFAACKGAVMAFSKSLARTLAPAVRVNCLAPGWIRTAWGEKASPTWQERVLKETPLARWGAPEDVARTARWLASPAAAFITGQIVRINGGA